MKIYVDLDNTLCKTKGTDYSNSQPLKLRIKKINELYNQGNIITIYTARGSVSKINYRDLTINQLSDWGVLYHELNIGEKPDFDLLIDDKAISDSQFFDKIS